MLAPLPGNEAQRLSSLRSFNILDTPREAVFEDLTRIAAQICRTPMAIISLVDRTRQWFKAEVGVGVPETSRDVSFCAHAILQNGLFIVPDAARDPRFFDNDLVTGYPHLRFYAGAVLHTIEGHALGTLCVLDRVPRELEDQQRAALEALARQAMGQMELRRALMEAEKVSRYRSRLMAVMGHDLKQPVNVVHMALSTLASRLQNEEDQEILAFAANAVTRLNSELDALALASRLDQESVRIERFPVQRVLDGALDNWSLRARRKGLKLRVMPCSLDVESDETMLTTILGNLVGNAIKYTETGGVLVGCRRRGGGVSIEVWDSGVGIPEAQLERIFQAFHQVDAGRSEGLGLGLAIVRRTAELLGYEIDVKSRPGRGSRFTIDIPLRLQAAAVVPPYPINGAGLQVPIRTFAL
jgi:signal transduction histidine kinase